MPDLVVRAISTNFPLVNPYYDKTIYRHKSKHRKRISNVRLPEPLSHLASKYHYEGQQSEESQDKRDTTYGGSPQAGKMTIP
jgi:hypothetical protein